MCHCMYFITYTYFAMNTRAKSFILPFTEMYIYHVKQTILIIKLIHYLET